MSRQVGLVGVLDDVDDSLLGLPLFGGRSSRPKGCLGCDRDSGRQVAETCLSGSNLFPPVVRQPAARGAVQPSK